jgi:hypothetical protein
MLRVARPTRRTQPPSILSKRVPAPIGGINTVDSGSAMPSQDCVYLYNMIAAEYGLRSRLGYKEWCTTLTGAEDNTVRSILPFSGSAKNGASDKLFAATQAGIWDVTASTAAPSQLVTYGTQTGDAGFGISCVAPEVTASTRHLLHCDEENGYFVYTEGGSWVQVISAATSNWQAGHAYIIGDKVLNDTGKTYQCITAGTSAGSGGPTGTSANITDNTAHWKYVQAVIAGVNPANLVFVAVFKNRVWLIERDTSKAWYLDIGAIYGTATAFNFGPRMRAGGPLVGLYNWSYDGGNGLDTLLVGISTAGDVVIYQGTDPASLTTFGLKGTWSVGGVPYGRRIATDYGGDVLILSLLGIVPLSKLVVGQPVVAGDRSIYATGKISNAFNLLASTFKSLKGWSLHIHPTDNALLVAVPTQDGQPTNQLAMSFATKGWSQYRELPMLSMGVWNGQLYFGTADGRVCINDGYVDNVSLDNTTYTAVAWSVLTSFSNLGTPRHKRVQMLKPTILSQTVSPIFQAVARFDFNLVEPDPPTGNPSQADGTWDGSIWDSSVWGGEYSPNQPLTGGSGMGRDIAIAVRGSAISRTTLVDVDVFYDVGGML